MSAAGNVGSSGATLLQYMGEPEVDQQTQVTTLHSLSLTNLYQLCNVGRSACDLIKAEYYSSQLTMLGTTCISVKKELYMYVYGSSVILGIRERGLKPKLHFQLPLKDEETGFLDPLSSD